jgi:hypothetical protein
MTGTLEQLHNMVRKGDILRHYLEESIKAPKLFSKFPPTITNSTWLECQLRLTHIGPYIINDEFDLALRESLWGCAGTE